MIKTIAITSSMPRLMLSEFFFIVFAHFLWSVEPIPPFLTPFAESEYVMPYGMKMACTKPLPASTDTVLFSLFPDKEDPSNHIQVSTANSWADMYSRISGLNVYLHSLRHAFTTNLARAGLPDSVIQEILGWSDISMVQVYKDIDSEEEFGKYFVDGEIIGQKQTSLSEL